MSKMKKKQHTRTQEEKNTHKTHRARKKLTVRTITTYWKLHNGFYYKHVIASITAAHNASVLLHNMFRCRLAGWLVGVCMPVCMHLKQKRIGLELHNENTEHIPQRILKKKVVRKERLRNVPPISDTKH